MEFLNKIFNNDFINSFAGALVRAGIKLIIATIILIVGLKLIKVFIKRIDQGKSLKRLNISVKSFTSSFLNIALKIILFITLAAYLGVPMSSMVALVASAGVAIGLALQGGLSNIASGMMIIIFHPFAVGDYIENGGYSGTVKSIGIFHTTLATPDNKSVIIPNSILTSETLVNYTASKTRRLDLNYSAAYSCDVDRVKAILTDCVNNIPEVIKDDEEKPIVVAVAEHAPSAVKYCVRLWCKRDDYWNISYRMNEDVKRAFDEAGIEIPYNKMDVKVISATTDSEKNY